MYAFDAEALLVSGNGANVGYVHYFNGKFNAYQRTYVITIFSADVQFLRLFLERNLRERIRVEVNAGNTPYITMGTLTEMEVVLPLTKDEQRAIALTLSDMDTLLDALDRLIAKKRDLKQAAMQQLLTGQTRLAGFSGEWTQTRLGDVATFGRGKGLPKSAVSAYGSERCVHYGELFTQYGDTIHETISRTSQSLNAIRSIANDVLMPTSDVTPRGLAKASCITITDVVLGGDILIIRASPKLIFGSFLSRMIRREEDQVLRLVKGTTVFHLHAAEMKKFVFKLPALAEQRAIVDVLSDMDAELAILASRRAKTVVLKQGMMQELLTGRTRLV